MADSIHKIMGSGPLTLTSESHDLDRNRAVPFVLASTTLTSHTNIWYHAVYIQHDTVAIPVKKIT